MNLQAWYVVQRYVAANALNIRKGYRLQDITDTELLGRTEDELHELWEEVVKNLQQGNDDHPNELEEFADTIACLMHFALRRGWSPDIVGETIVKKLELRFGLVEASVTP